MLVVCSLWGSPGVTTLSYRLASALSAEMGRASMLVETDESGGDLALRLGLQVTFGFATLAAAARRGLCESEVWNHVQESPTGVGLVVGLGSAEQSRALSSTWEECARCLAQIGDVDVIVDTGRLAPGMATMEPFLRRASGVLVVARPDAASIVHATRRMATLQTFNPSVSIVLAGAGPYEPREVEEATGVAVVASVDRGSPGLLAQAGAAAARYGASRRSGDREVVSLAERLLEAGYLGGAVFAADERLQEEDVKLLEAGYLGTVAPQPESNVSTVEAEGNALRSISLRDLQARRLARTPQNMRSPLDASRTSRTGSLKEGSLTASQRDESLTTSLRNRSLTTSLQDESLTASQRNEEVTASFCDDCDPACLPSASGGSSR
jgi:MinD-like ATPase involved in chromosome partitioning or flagellar assembly